MEGGAGGEEKEEGEAGAWGVGGREGERERGEAVKTKIAACGSQTTDMIDDIHPMQKEGSSRRRWPQHTHRGARTHNHKVKSLALCRLS